MRASGLRNWSVARMRKILELQAKEALECGEISVGYFRDRLEKQNSKRNGNGGCLSQEISWGK